MDTVPRYDTLNLFDTCLQVRQLIGEKNKVIFSCKLQKYNRWSFLQERFLVVSDQNMHVLSQGEYSYIENRKLPLEMIFGFTQNDDPKSSEVVIHARDAHCERYDC